MKKYSSNKEINQFVKLLIKNNWKFTFGSKHGRLQSPDGIKYTVPKSPSDWRASLNFKRDIFKKYKQVAYYG